MPVSIFNDVLGPVMRGPSSSHTAGAYRIARLARSLLGRAPRSVVCRFDPGGSMATTYRPLAVDRAFAAGLMEWDLLDERFAKALDHAPPHGIELSFEVAPFPEADHPNAFLVRMCAEGGEPLRVIAKSTGGGGVRVTGIQGHPVDISGGYYETVVEALPAPAREIVGRFGLPLDAGARGGSDPVALQLSRPQGLEPEERRWIASLPGVSHVWSADPVLLVERGEPLLSSSEQMVQLAADRDLSLGRLALEHEAQLLGISEREALAEMGRRWEVMKASVTRGLAGEGLAMQLLEPVAGQVFAAAEARRVAVGGLHTRAAARAMAVMHVSSSLGIVCAAPTGGSAGVLPGALVTLAEERGLGDESALLALFAASAIGLVIANRGTFAAEIAGCQVEIGAAGAMAAAAVVQAGGGSAQQATDAAAIAYQNTMGSVCDLVQGIVEVPCHTRNAVAASSAFVCADLVLGGYGNPVNLDETIDAVYAVGKMLPRELKVTALGGLALAPSAQALPNLRQS
jgi:L-serine dehydratase